MVSYIQCSECFYPRSANEFFSNSKICSGCLHEALLDLELEFKHNLLCGSYKAHISGNCGHINDN